MAESTDAAETDTADGELIAVYGTLMRGFENHERANLATCEFSGACEIPGVLYDCGAYPGLKLDGNGTVSGEVYWCQSTVLHRLDLIEGATGSDPLFTRREIDLVDPQVSAWVYEYAQSVATLDRIPSGSWRSYATD